MYNNFFKKKELLMKLNSDEINKRVLYLINEARSSPNQFSEHIINDNRDIDLINLSSFFKYNSKEVYPLILDKNLTICSKDLLAHLISIDDGSSIFKYTPEEKIKNNLKERLKRLNLIPINYNHFIIIGAENSLEALINLFLNKDYRYKILSPEMNYIGIASGLLPSEKLCIIIDIVNSLRMSIYNFTPMEYNNYSNNNINDKNIKMDNSCYIRKNLKPNYSYNNIKMKSEKKNFNTKKIFNTPYITKTYKKKNNYYNIYRKKNDDDNAINLKILRQKYINLNKNENESFYLDDSIKEYKLPISISYDKKYKKDRNGNYYPILTKELKYDDGSILIQPNDDDDFY